MSERKRCIVYGYIRKIEPLLLHNDSIHIIPQCVVEICYQYYFVQILIAFKIYTDDTKTGNVAKYHVFDHALNKITSYNTTTQTICSPNCFIQGIPSKFKYESLKYVAFGWNTKHDDDLIWYQKMKSHYPSFILFKYNKA